ncbi:MAG: aryl-sulfate sulfotransferase [Acidobacteriota bacterium]|nr:aryl-sulfate sulfotransferase [Acidobacteriota bacterium]
MKKVLMIAIVAAAIGCGGPPQLTSDIELEANPSGKVPLAALLRFTTDQPARVTLAIDNGDDVTEVTPSQALVTEHEVMVLGTLPGRTNVIEVRLAGESGEAVSVGSVDFETPPLPDLFPPIEVLTSRPDRMEPGITLLPFFRWEGNSPEPDDEWGLFVGLNAQGDVVWYYQVEHVLEEPLRISNGNLIYQSTTSGIMYEIDMLGRVQRTWVTRYAEQDKKPEGAIEITDGDTLHHDMQEMPSGNFLALSTEVRPLEWAMSPAPDAEVKERKIIGDVVIEFQPDGKVVRSWKLFDVLDTDRRGSFAYGTDFYKEAYEPVYGEDDLPVDWTHTNALWYLPEQDSVLLSVPAQSAILKLDMASGELDWILGLPDEWREPWADLRLQPEGDVEWFSFQHAVERSDRGTVLLYGNNVGFWGQPIQDKDNFTSILEYEVDEEAGTFKQVWRYGGPADNDRFLSPFISEADSQPQTGNVLFVNGGLLTDKNGEFTTNFGAGHHWTSVMEVTRDSPAEKVWEVVIDDPEGGWASYRIERVPSLYPGV